MSKRDPMHCMRQMLDFSREAVKIAHGRVRDDLDRDHMLRYSLIYLVETIGEAANRVPRETQLKYPQLPWTQMIGARNRLIHGYDTVDLDILWSIVSKDLPQLSITLEQIIPSE